MFLQLAELFNGSGWDDVLWTNSLIAQRVYVVALDTLHWCRCGSKKSIWWKYVTQDYTQGARVRTQSWRLFLQFVEQRDEPDEAINQAEKTKTNNHWLQT